MSLICILAPVIVTAWPSFSAAIIAGAGAMGFSVVNKTRDHIQQQVKESDPKKINLEIPCSEVVFDRLGRGEKIVVEKEGITVSFTRDIRNRVSICVEGRDYSEDRLKQIGENLCKRVVQEYVYQKIKAQLIQMNGILLEENIEEDNSIRIKVRTWQ